MPFIASHDRVCRTCGCTDADCSACIARTGQPCFWAEDDLCSACRVWRPLSALVERPGHIFLREPDGTTRTWRWRDYRRGSGTPSGIKGRWQVSNEYGFRNARLPTEGEWAPSPSLTTPPLNRDRGPFPKHEQRGHHDRSPD